MTLATDTGTLYVRAVLPFRRDAAVQEQSAPVAVRAAAAAAKAIARAAHGLSDPLVVLTEGELHRQFTSETRAREMYWTCAVCGRTKPPQVAVVVFELREGSWVVVASECLSHTPEELAAGAAAAEAAG